MKKRLRLLYRRRRPLIMETAANVPAWVHAVNYLLTILLWLAYFYMIRHAFYFLVDVVEWVTVEKRPQDLDHFGASLLWLGGCLLLVLASNLLFIGWARYNWIRFRGKDRRKFRPPVTNEALAEFFHIPVESVNAWQQQKLIVMSETFTSKSIPGSYKLP